MYKKKPFFIIFEGVEGCGKSYQSQKLKKNLEKKGVYSLLTREPGGTRSAESIRRLILKDYFNKGNNEKFDKYTDTLLYLAARNEHVKNKIKPALKKDNIVICDRFVDSTYAYQVYGKKVKESFIKNIHQDVNSFKITKTITDLSNSIGAEIVAEYVHNDEVQKIVEDLGIQFSQGFLFSEPSPDIIPVKG